MSESKKPLLPTFSQRVEKVIDTLKLPEEANKELMLLTVLMGIAQLTRIL